MVYTKVFQRFKIQEVTLLFEADLVVYLPTSID